MVGGGGLCMTFFLVTQHFQICSWKAILHVFTKIFPEFWKNLHLESIRFRSIRFCFPLFEIKVFRFLKCNSKFVVWNEIHRYLCEEIFCKFQTNVERIKLFFWYCTLCRQLGGCGAKKQEMYVSVFSGYIILDLFFAGVLGSWLPTLLIRYNAVSPSHVIALLEEAKDSFILVRKQRRFQICHREFNLMFTLGSDKDQIVNEP